MGGTRRIALAALSLVIGACGSAGQTAHPGSGGTGGGAGSGTGGAAGGTGGSGAGGFPFTGRWWGRFMNNAGQVTLPVVLHWDAEAPGDRAWWTTSSKQAVTATGTADGWEITVGNGACYRLAASNSTPDELELWNCAPTNPLDLGYLRRATAKLVTEIAIGAGGAPVPDGEIAAAGFSNDGTEAAVMVNGHYWAWKAAASRSFDLRRRGAPRGGEQTPAQNGYARVAFSPDGRWIAFPRANDPTGDTNSSIVLHDTSSDGEQILTASGNSQTPVFSADGTRLIFYDNYPQGHARRRRPAVAADLACGDVGHPGQGRLAGGYLPPTAWSTAGGRHLLFAVVPEHGDGTNASVYGRLDLAGQGYRLRRRRSGALAAPDLSFVALRDRGRRAT